MFTIFFLTFNITNFRSVLSLIDKFTFRRSFKLKLLLGLGYSGVLVSYTKL